MKPRQDEQQSVQRQQEFSMPQLMELHLGFAPARTLMSAMELDVFSKIYDGHRTAARIAAAAGAAERGIGMLLDALTSMRLLEKKDDQYSLTPFAAQYMVRASPDCLGDFLTLEPLWESWGKLTESVRTGRPYRHVETQQEAEEFFPKLVRGLHIVHREPAQKIARLLGAGNGRRGLQVLDVAAGSGVWGIPFAEADAGTRVTAQDFPGMLDVTREHLRRHRVEGQYDYLAGDLKRVDFGAERYDVALLGNIVHSEGEDSSRDLFRRLHRALRDGGEMVVIDMIPNDARTGPPFAALFALNMLVNTDSGGTYTVADYRRWLQDAGFQHVETADIEWHSPLVLARK